MRKNIFKCGFSILAGVLFTRFILDIMATFSIEIYNSISLLGGGGLQEFSAHLSFVTYATLIQVFKIAMVVVYLMGMLYLVNMFVDSSKELVDKLNKKG